MNTGNKTVSSPKIGTSKGISIPAIEFQQNSNKLYAFSMKASVAWPLFSISRRDDETKEGYQRVLSTARVASMAKFILSNNPVPVSIVIALENASFSDGLLHIPDGNDVGWVIDGQHRLAGAHQAVEKGVDIELSFVAFNNIDLDTKVKQFLTINSEGRGVPKSLLLDLLKHLPDLTPKQIADQRATDIGEALRRNESGPLLNRIVILGSPDRNQISLNNFARKVAPLVHPERGRLRQWSLEKQISIFDNYFSAIKRVFIREWSKPNSIFFKTVGFGAWMNLFTDIFDRSLSEKKGFTVDDISSYLSMIEDFDFAQWSSLGSGTKAEQLAAEDMRTELHNAITATSDTDADPDIRL